MRLAIVSGGLLALSAVAIYARQRARRRGLRTFQQPQIRDAGPENMRSHPRRWEAQDQRNDESFPASDPPATY